MQNEDRAICSGPSAKAKLTARTIKSIFFHPTKRPHKILLFTPAVSVSGAIQFKTSLNIMLLLHGTWGSESNSRHQPYSVWDIFEAEYTRELYADKGRRNGNKLAKSHFCRSKTCFGSCQGQALAAFSPFGFAVLFLFCFASCISFKGHCGDCWIPCFS